MQGRSGYLHVLDGRMRIHIPRVKNSVIHAARLQARLRGEPGVLRAQANHLTGNVLIHFDSSLTRHDLILDWLMERGWVAPAPAESPATGGNDLARLVAETIVKTAVKRMVMRII